jgi:hypothetical protein
MNYCCNPRCFVCGETMIPPHGLEYVAMYISTWYYYNYISDITLHFFPFYELNGMVRCQVPLSTSSLASKRASYYWLLNLSNTNMRAI